MVIELEYDGRVEKTTKTVLTRYFNISETILDGLIAISQKKDGTFKLGKGIVMIDRKARRNKATVNIVIENAVKMTKPRKPRTKMIYVYNGKDYQTEEFAAIFGGSKGNLSVKTRGLKSATINGLDVTMKLEPIVKAITLPFIYNGKELHKDVSYKDLAGIFSRTEAHMCWVVRNDKLEKTTGFKIYETNPLEGK